MEATCLLQATNAVGDSQWSRPGFFTTKARVPSCPAAPVCQAVSADTMRISWDMPSSNGSPITLYQCFMDDGQGGNFQLIYTGEQPFCERAGLKVCSHCYSTLSDHATPEDHLQLLSSAA